MVTVLMGLPASGKTTWSHENCVDAVVVTSDPIRCAGVDPSVAFGEMKRQVVEALSQGKDVIIDACSAREADRSPWIFLARRFKAKTRLVFIDTAVKICRLRDAKREKPSRKIDIYVERIEESRKRIRRELWDQIEVIK